MALREFYETIPSTQERAIELARAGATGGTRVIARHQSRGQGRLRRPWASPGGGFYGSFILADPPQHPGLLPLSVGAKLAQALRETCSIAAALKWPNDLLVPSGSAPARKLSGILLDEVSSPTLGRAAVVGVGVNVRSPSIGAAGWEPTRFATLEEYANPVPSLDEVEEIVAGAVLAAGKGLETAEGVHATRALCRNILYGVGRPITVDGKWVGTLEGIGDEGELWVSTETDRVAIWAGDVRVQEAV